MTAQNVFSQKKPLQLSTVKSLLDPSSSTYDKTLEAFARNWLRVAYEGHEDTGVKPWLAQDHPNYVVHLDKSSGVMKGRISLSGRNLYEYIENAYMTGLIPEYANLLDTSANASAPAAPAPAPAPVQAAAPQVKPKALPPAPAKVAPAPVVEVEDSAPVSASSTSLEEILAAINSGMDTSQRILDEISAVNGRLDSIGEEVASHHAELSSRIAVLEQTVARLFNNVATIDHVKSLQEGQRTLALLLSGGTEDFDEIMRDLDRKIDSEKDFYAMATSDVHAIFMSDPVYSIIADTIGSQNPTVLLNKIRHDSSLRGKVLEALIPWLEESGESDQVHRLRVSPLPTLMQYITHTVTTIQSP